jgi:hypothetical protein
MMENSVSQIADVLPTDAKANEVPFICRRMRKSLFGKMVSDAGLTVCFIEEARPKTEVQFGDHTAGRHRLAEVSQRLLCVENAVSLPWDQPGGGRIIPGVRPTARRECLMNGIAQCDFGE